MLVHSACVVGIWIFPHKHFWPVIGWTVCWHFHQKAFAISWIVTVSSEHREHSEDREADHEAMTALGAAWPAPRRLVGGKMRLPLRFTKLLRLYPPVPAIKQLPSQIHSSSCILKDNPEYVKLKRLHKERENRWVIAPTSSRSAASWFNSSFATNSIGDGRCEKKALTLTTQAWIGASRC